VGSVVLGLFVVGIIVSAALGGVPPNPLGPATTVTDYYRHHSAAAQAQASRDPPRPHRPSRVVAFVDELQARGYVTRERNDTDRRLYALHLTELGRELMTQLGDVAREHDRQITAGLTATQKSDLKRLLAQNGRTPRPHSRRASWFPHRTGRRQSTRRHTPAPRVINWYGRSRRNTVSRLSVN
jgi:hypothetical protein